MVSFDFMAYIYLNPRKQQLEDARNELSGLVTHRDQLLQNAAELNIRIQQLEALIRAVAPLAEREQAPQSSLADYCRMALAAYNGQWVTAKQVRDYLVQLGLRFDYANEMSVIHNTLQRVAQMTKISGQTFYAAKG